MGNNLRTSIADSQWLVLKEPTDPTATGTQLVRCINTVDVTTSATLVDTLQNSSPVTNPVAAGVTYAGKWVVSDCYIEVDHKNHGKIVELLTKVQTVDTEMDLPKTPIIKYGYDLINIFGRETADDNTIAYQYLYLNPASESTIKAMSIVVLKPVGYTEAVRKTTIEERGDRTCTLNVLYRTIAWTNNPPAIDEAPPREYQTHEEGTASEKTEGLAAVLEYPGVPTEDAEAALNVLKHNTDVPTWAIAGVSTSERSDGEAVINRQLQKINDAITADDALLVELGWDAKGTPTSYMREWPNVTPESAHTLIGTSSEPGIAGSDFTISTEHAGAATYTSKKVWRIRDSKTGLVTVRQIGDNDDSGSRLGFFRYGVGEYVVKQWFTPSANAGNVWRCTERLLVTESGQLADAFLNATPESSDTTYNSPVGWNNQQQQRVVRDGLLSQDISTGYWQALRREWRECTAPGCTTKGYQFDHTGDEEP